MIICGQKHDRYVPFILNFKWKIRGCRIHSCIHCIDFCLVQFDWVGYLNLKTCSSPGNVYLFTFMFANITTINIRQHGPVSRKQWPTSVTLFPQTMHILSACTINIVIQDDDPYLTTSLFSHIFNLLVHTVFLFILQIPLQDTQLVYC